MKHINANHNAGIRRQTMLVRMFTAMLMLLVALPVCAQKGLGVDEVFRRFGHERGSKMVEMNNTSLMGYRLKVYKSLIYRKNAAEIEAILKGDRRQAKKIRECPHHESRLMSSSKLNQEKASDGRAYSVLYLPSVCSDCFG